MKKPKSPCYNCPDRQPGCHGSCGKYQAFHTDIITYAHNINMNRHIVLPLELRQHMRDGRIKLNKKEHAEREGYSQQ